MDRHHWNTLEELLANLGAELRQLQKEIAQGMEEIAAQLRQEADPAESPGFFSGEQPAENTRLDPEYRAKLQFEQLKEAAQAEGWSPEGFQQAADTLQAHQPDPCPHQEYSWLLGHSHDAASCSCSSGSKGDPMKQEKRIAQLKEELEKSYEHNRILEMQNRALYKAYEAAKERLEDTQAGNEALNRHYQELCRAYEDALAHQYTPTPWPEHQLEELTREHREIYEHCRVLAYTADKQATGGELHKRARAALYWLLFGGEK